MNKVVLLNSFKCLSCIVTHLNPGLNKSKIADLPKRENDKSFCVMLLHFKPCEIVSLFISTASLLAKSELWIHQ